MYSLLSDKKKICGIISSLRKHVFSMKREVRKNEVSNRLFF